MACELSILFHVLKTAIPLHPEQFLVDIATQLMLKREGQLKDSKISGFTKKNAALLFYANYAQTFLNSIQIPVSGCACVKRRSPVPFLGS